jgi:hypothetical protein
MGLDLLLLLNELLALYRPQFHTTPLLTHSACPDIRPGLVTRVSEQTHSSSSIILSTVRFCDSTLLLCFSADNRETRWKAVMAVVNSLDNFVWSGLRDAYTFSFAGEGCLEETYELTSGGKGG